ncbi:MAG: dienelactone hydrolase family protein [Parafilimonas sp.]|nr:dienelactone hydrolase family protein [Parafilimonas sp.]
MQKLLLVFIFIVTGTLLFAQKMAPCCAPATQQFAALADDKDFIMSHDVPLPFIYRSANGADITFKAAEGTDAHGWMVKAAKPTDYYMFVIHEYWGLNDYIKQESEKLSNDLGVNVIALDLYDNKVATTPEDAGKLMQAVKPERAMAIIKGAFMYAGSKAKVFTIGWCFGGGWSLQTAIIGGSQVKGCIMYYGMPEKDVNKLKALHCDVIGFFGNQDKWITPQVVDEFKTNMKAADKKVTTYEYDADHAFANPSSAHNNKEAAANAYAKTLAFVKERMK